MEVPQRITVRGDEAERPDSVMWFPDDVSIDTCLIAGMASLLRRIAIDVSPLRGSRDFRRLWSGLLLTGVGYHFTVVATFIQVYDLTGSTTAVGLVGLVGLAGIVIGIVGGGTFIDAIDRRTTLLWSQVAAGAGSGLLLIGAMLDRPPLWLLYVAVALISGFSAIDSSVRNATVPRLVGRDQLPSALALNQVVMNATALLGPALAGVVIARFGLVAAYTVDVLSYIVMFAIVWTIRPVPPEGAGRPRHRVECGEARASPTCGVVGCSRRPSVRIWSR